MQLAEISPNPYHPNLMRIAGFTDETADVRTLRLEFADAAEAQGFGGWQPGQFGQFTVFGAGESVFAIANRPWSPNGGAEGPTVECTFRAIGKVTTRPARHVARPDHRLQRPLRQPLPSRRLEGQRARLSSAAGSGWRPCARPCSRPSTVRPSSATS